MSVRKLSRRKALKYGAIAALGLGAGVALGDVTGADRLVHAASPSSSDPVFSGTGIQFPSLTSDPSQLVGNMWYRSDLTAMKYSDGTNAHELAALDIAQTFTAVQTFNGGIVFNAAGSIAGTSTYMEASGAAGYPIINDASGSGLHFRQDGTDFAYITNLYFASTSDSTMRLGANTARWIDVVSNLFEVYHASGDTYPSAQLGDGFLELGSGGSSPLALKLSFNTGPGIGGLGPLVVQPLVSNTQGEIDIGPSGTSEIATLALFSTLGTNQNFLAITESGNSAIIGTGKSGTATAGPLIFETGLNDTPTGGIEAFRITTTPQVQFSVPIFFGTASIPTSTTTGIGSDGAGGNLIFNVPTGKTPIFEIAGSTVLKVVTNGAGLGGIQTGGGYLVEDDGSGNLGFYYGTTESFRLSGGGSLLALGGLNFNVDNSAYNAALFQIDGSSGKVSIYDSINTVGLGLPAEYASTLTTAVAIGTTSTVIKTYTPTADGQFLVVVSVEASVASTISSLTVTYTDATSGVSTTQTLATSVAVALNNAVTFTALCNATTASAISVQATAAAATDLYASATVLAL